METTLNFTHMVWALGLGAISAVSLPLGSWLGLVWKPKDSVTGGMAAGAMLTMIAAAMLPEAAHKGGGNISGIFTMLGFISALAFKLLE